MKKAILLLMILFAIKQPFKALAQTPNAQPATPAENAGANQTPGLASDLPVDGVSNAVTNSQANTPATNSATSPSAAPVAVPAVAASKVSNQLPQKGGPALNPAPGVAPTIDSAVNPASPNGGVLSQAASVLKGSSLDLFAMKGHIEKQITERVSYSLGTALAKDSYWVNVDVQLVEKPLENLNRESALKHEPIPGDLTLGVVDAEPLIRLYADRVRELEQTRGASEGKSLDRYQVVGVHLLVGIDEGYSAAYRAELLTWLKQWSSNNFGPQTTVEIKAIHNPPPKKIEQSPEEKAKELAQEKAREKEKLEEKEREKQKELEAKEREREREKAQEKAQENANKPETFLDQMHKIQNLVGFGFIALSLIVAVFLISTTLSKNNKEHLEHLEAMAKQARPQLPVQQNEEEKKKEQDANLPISDESVTVMRDLRELKELNQKVVDLHQELGLQLRPVLSIWFDNSKPGLRKFAGFLDCIMNNDETDLANLNLPPVPEDKKPMIAEVFREMANLSAREKVAIMRQVYWELMTSRVIGHDTLKRPFNYVGSMSVKEVHELVQTQPTESQTLLVLNLPDTLREPFLKSSELELKRKVIKQALSTDSFEPKDVELLSEAVKVTANKIRTGGFKVPVLPLAQQVLRDMDAGEEVTVLREITPSLRDRGVELKMNHLTLAFVDEWKDEWIKRLSDRTQPEHWVALLRVVPAIEERVLSLMPVGLQEIVRDDLKLADRSKPAEKDKLLREMKYYLQIELGEAGLDTKDLYEFKEESSARAA